MGLLIASFDKSGFSFSILICHKSRKSSIPCGGAYGKTSSGVNSLNILFNESAYILPSSFVAIPIVALYLVLLASAD